MKGKITGSTLLCVNSGYESIMFSISRVSNDAKEHLMREAVKRIFELFIFLFYLVQILVNVENLEVSLLVPQLF